MVKDICSFRTHFHLTLKIVLFTTIHHRDLMVLKYWSGWTDVAATKTQSPGVRLRYRAQPSVFFRFPEMLRPKTIANVAANLNTLRNSADWSQTTNFSASSALSRDVIAVSALCPENLQSRPRNLFAGSPLPRVHVKARRGFVFKGPARSRASCCENWKLIRPVFA